MFNKKIFPPDDVVVPEEMKKELAKLVKKYGRKIFDYCAEIKASGGLAELLETAWYGEEKETDIISLAECIEWVKTYLDRDKHSGAIIAKEQIEGKLTLKICYMGTDGKVLPDEESRYLIIRCRDMDEKLKNQFGDKNTIVLS